MTIIILLFIASLLFFVERVIKDKLSKRFLLPFILVWCVGMVVASSGAYGFDSPKESTFVWLMLHILAFCIGFSLVKINVRSITEESRLFNIGNSILLLEKNKVFKGAFIVSFIYIVINFLKYYQAIALYSSLAEMRGDFFSGEIYGDDFLLLNNMFLGAFRYVIIALLSYKLLHKRDWFCIPLILYVVMYSLLAGGRGEFADILLGFAFTALCIRSSKMIKFSRKRILTISFVVIGLYLSLCWITTSREEYKSFTIENLMESTDDTNKDILEYVGGPVVAFDYALNSDLTSKLGGNTYGMMTFACFEDFVYYSSILTNLFLRIGIYERKGNLIGSYLNENKISIGKETTSWNALYTACINYYFDFGYFGLIFIPFILGMFVRYLIKRLSENPNAASYILCLLFFIAVFNSILRIFMGRACFFLLIVYLLKKDKKSKMYDQITL